jgi:hypothetical protein
MTTTKTVTFDTRVSGGVELISAKAIRQYAADGHSERWIARRIGCNPYFVEKVLREQTEAAITRLSQIDKLGPHAIAAKLRLPCSRVQRFLNSE